MVFQGLIFLVCAGLLAPTHGARGADSGPPNILFIVGDDLGYADVGFQGGTEIPTPHLDALAKRGVRFTSGYVSGPYCSPTRAGLMTGRYQQRFGHEFNPDEPGNGLPGSEATLADRLRAAGYSTGLVGKWHLGAEPGRRPNDRGFDEFYGFLGGMHGYFDPVGIFRNEAPVDALDHTTDAFAREAVSFIRRHRERPWFLCLAFNAVHTPMEATAATLDRFRHVADEKRRTYCAMMSAMDDAIGQVVAQLEATGQSENTLIAFISDNGGPVMNGTTVNASSNAPWRGGKRTTLEGGIRVPFVVAWPGRIPPGVIDDPVIQLDLHATALGAARIVVDPEWHLDGVDLLPRLTGATDEAPHRSLFWRLGRQFAIRRGPWKLVAYDTDADTDLEQRQPVSSVRLYNLDADTHEDADLSKTHPDRVRELAAEWADWNRLNVAPLWGNDRTLAPR